MTKIVVVGDIFVKPDTMAEEAAKLNIDDSMKIVKLDWENKSKEIFRERAHNIELNGPEAEEMPEGFIEEIEDADIIITHFCPIPKKAIERAKNLRIIATCRGGMEHIDVDFATQRGIPVIHCIRNAVPVADFVVGMIICETRNIARGHEMMKARRWVKDYPNSKFTKNLDELRVGILGLGYIGKLTAKKLNALNIEVWGTDPFVDEKELEEEGLKVKKVEIEELFSQCDVVSLHLRLNKKTENMVSSRLLSKMKKSSYLINSSRAGVVKEDDLFEVLKNKKIAGAAIDVWWKEPIDRNNKFLSLDNVTMTPHIAGDTVNAIPLSPRLLVKEINRYFEAGKSKMIVNGEGLKNNLL